MKYYAVVCGVQPGIYTDWPTAEKMVKGFPGAIFKSFHTRAEAEAFIAKSGQQTYQKPQAQQVQKAQAQQQTYQKPQALPLVDATIIYTDGSRDRGRCGYGVVMLPTTGEKFVAYGYVPPNLGITNNVAELYAIYVALSLVQGNVMLYSDSKYAIGVLTGMNAVANVGLIQGIKNLIGDRDVRFEHVRAHVGIELNEEADRLADYGRDQDEHLVVIKDGQRLDL